VVVAKTAGWWYSLAVAVGVSAEAQKASFESIAATLERTLRAASAPTTVEVVDPFDCESADTGGLPVTSSRNTPVPADAIVAAAFRAAGPTTCSFTTGDGQWDLDVYPSGASLYTQCTHFPLVDLSRDRSLSIRGVEAAAERWREGETAEICATDGTSLITVRHQFSDVDATVLWDATSLGTAGSLLSPVFLAAA
jgi:hypothetical protein